MNNNKKCFENPKFVRFLFPLYVPMQLKFKWNGVNEVNNQLDYYTFLIVLTRHRVKLLMKTEL